MGELFETERKRTKEKESKFAFFCFLLIFGIGAFQWVTVEKSEKNVSLPPFASGLRFPPRPHRSSPPRRPRVADSILRKHYHRFLFSANQIAALIALAVGRSPCPARGCFPVAAALDAAIRVSALTPV
ncbi:MAG: hypothetical protein WAN05_06030 [Roseiarcus sp.]